MNIASSIRIKDWWRPKAGLLLALLFFAAFLKKVALDEFIVPFVLSLVTLSAIGIFGHLLNDLGDIETDRKAGKENRLADKTPLQRIFLFLAIGIIALVPWVFLPATLFSYILLAGEFFLLLIYALPPFRLKKHPRIAVWIDAIYAYSLPSVLAFYTYNLAFGFEINWVYFVLLFIWTTIVGLRHIIYHHVADAKNDLLSGLGNLANSHGVYRLNKIIRKYMLSLELVLGIAFFFSFWETLHFLMLVFALPFVLLFGPWSASMWKAFSNHQLFHFTADFFYTNIFLGIGIIVCGLYQPLYFLFLAPFFPIFLNLHGKRVFSIIHKLLAKTYKLLSIIVNYSIYYFRKYVLRWDEKRNRGVYYEDWIENKLKNKREHIAILNSNYDKYTETFVGGHQHNLPYNIEYYYGENLDVHAKDGKLGRKHKEIEGISIFFQKLFKLSPQKLLATHLQEKKVKLMLCEFGPNGAYSAPVASMTGIPLICIFYGYDAWHKKTLKEYETAYQELFETAASIVGVSKDICNQLEQLGCPKEKIHYLPCYVNLDLFTQKNSQTTDPIFLSIGRFAETKSPHLTILAFNEVLKEIPNATLRMIGKDGGGELFEACHILAKALKIESSIEFLGVKSPVEIKNEMGNARVFVQHSLTTPLSNDKEGTPVAIMEAMARGMAIISTKHAGIEEMIETDTSGVLVDEYDYISMAKEMVRVCKSDELVAMLGKNASQSIRKNPLVSQHIEKLSKLIDKHKMD